MMGLLRTRKDVHVQEYGISRFIPTVVKMIKDIIPRITSWPYVFCNILMHQLGKSTLYHSRSYVRAGRPAGGGRGSGGLLRRVDHLPPPIGRGKDQPFLLTHFRKKDLFKQLPHLHFKALYQYGNDQPFQSPTRYSSNSMINQSWPLGNTRRKARGLHWGRADITEGHPEASAQRRWALPNHLPTSTPVPTWVWKPPTDAA